MSAASTVHPRFSLPEMVGCGMPVFRDQSHIVSVSPLNVSGCALLDSVLMPGGKVSALSRGQSSKRRIKVVFEIPICLAHAAMLCVTPLNVIMRLFFVGTESIGLMASSKDIPLLSRTANVVDDIDKCLAQSFRHMVLPSCV